MAVCTASYKYCLDQLILHRENKSLLHTMYLFCKRATVSNLCRLSTYLTHAALPIAEHYNAMSVSHVLFGLIRHIPYATMLFTTSSANEPSLLVLCPNNRSFLQHRPYNIRKRLYSQIRRIIFCFSTYCHATKRIGYRCPFST